MKIEKIYIIKQKFTQHVQNAVVIYVYVLILSNEKYYTKQIFFFKLILLLGTKIRINNKLQSQKYRTNKHKILDACTMIREKYNILACCLYIIFYLI